jgi:hypothetical protein
MLADDKIINIIKEYEREYAILRKDSDAFHKRLATKLLNTVDDEKEQVFDFFLREIKSNENDLCGTALIIIEKMRAVELCPRIVDIYYEISKYKDDLWKRAVVSVLMRFRYLPPKDLYRSYVFEYMKKNEISFFLLVQYCNVNPVEALPLLSNEIIEKMLSEKLLSQPPEKIGTSLQGIGLLIADLITNFKDNPNDYLPKLLEIVNAKKHKAAVYLRAVIINYLSSEFAKYSYSKSWIDNEINKLNNLCLL